MIKHFSLEYSFTDANFHFYDGTEASWNVTDVIKRLIRKEVIDVSITFKMSDGSITGNEASGEQVAWRYFPATGTLKFAVPEAFNDSYGRTAIILTVWYYVNENCSSNGSANCGSSTCSSSGCGTGSYTGCSSSSSSCSPCSNACNPNCGFYC
ncbi:MAG: hypothetical protein LBR73_03455 [Oscillospiraceae bacterium]|jgi:hypothetical protein|nr:hypothetical protein [Oscillospiraceae bacterium]